MSNAPYYISEHFNQIMPEVKSLFSDNYVHGQCMQGGPGSESDIQIEDYFPDGCDLFISHDINSDYPQINGEAPDGFADIVLWCTGQDERGSEVCQQNWPGHRIALSDLTPEWIMAQASVLRHTENYMDASGETDPIDDREV